MLGPVSGKATMAGKSPKAEIQDGEGGRGADLTGEPAKRGSPTLHCVKLERCSRHIVSRGTISRVRSRIRTSIINFHPLINNGKSLNTELLFEFLVLK